MKTITITIEDEAYGNLLQEVRQENEFRDWSRKRVPGYDPPAQTVENLLTEIATTYAIHGYVD